MKISKYNIEQVLLKIGVPTEVKGFSFITYAIMLLDRKEWENPQWCLLYYEVGKHFGTTQSKAERAIRHAFSVARTKGNHDDVERYIGFDNCKNSSSLKTLYLNIKHECAENINTFDASDHKALCDNANFTLDDIRSLVRSEIMNIMREMMADCEEE